MDRRHLMFGILALAIGSAPALAAKGAGAAFSGSWSGKVGSGTIVLRVEMVKLDGTIGGTVTWPGGWSSFTGRADSTGIRGRLSKGGSFLFTSSGSRQLRGSVKASGKTFNTTLKK